MRQIIHCHEARSAAESGTIPASKGPLEPAMAPQEE